MKLAVWRPSNYIRTIFQPTPVITTQTGLPHAGYNTKLRLLWNLNLTLKLSEMTILGGWEGGCFQH